MVERCRDSKSARPRINRAINPAPPLPKSAKARDQHALFFHLFLNLSLALSRVFRIWRLKVSQNVPTVAKSKASGNRETSQKIVYDERMDFSSLHIAPLRKILSRSLKASFSSTRIIFLSSFLTFRPKANVSSRFSINLYEFS